MLVWERVTLESLAKKAKSLEALALDTSLSPTLLKKILLELQKKKLVFLKENIYVLNLEFNFERISPVPEEVKDLLGSVVDEYFKQNFSAMLKLKKCTLSTVEMGLLQKYFYSIESLIENACTKRSTKTCDQKVIVWAYTNYKTLLKFT